MNARNAGPARPAYDQYRVPAPDVGTPGELTVVMWIGFQIEPRQYPV
jgi:hypothetical protein